MSEAIRGGGGGGGTGRHLCFRIGNTFTNVLR